MIDADQPIISHNGSQSTFLREAEFLLTSLGDGG